MAESSNRLGPQLAAEAISENFIARGLSAFLNLGATSRMIERRRRCVLSGSNDGCP
jgi:hypothetical protein